MFTMPSKYNSRCKLCGGAISVGDEIAKRNGVWAHAVCPDDQPAATSIRQANILKSFNAEADVAPAAVVDLKAFEPVQAADEVKHERPFIPSSLQSAIFDFGLNGTGNLVVKATAGSGKTRTIQEFIKRYIPASKSWIYLVFNKKNQLEAQEKFGELPNGTVATFHSFTLTNAVKPAIGKSVKIDDKKSYRLLEQLSDRDTEKELWPTIVKIVGLTKNTLTDANDYEALVAMCDHYGVELNGAASRVLELVRDVVALSKATTWMIDFDDMLWLTVVNGYSLPQFDYILVDETQDLNAVQIKIVLSIVKSDGRAIAIGDDNQAIYGFRGADADAMQKVSSALNATELPLSICYRNPKSVVRLVNETFPEIKHECPDDAPEGEVISIQESKLFEHVQRGDMVICRTNAPLVRPAFELIKRGIKAVIMGRSIGEELINLINRVTKRINTDNLNVLLAALEEYKLNEVAKLMRQQKESTAQALEDKVETIYALADGCTVLAELIEKAQTIFSDDAKGVVFSSAHRAKGLEADNVFILKYELMPHPMAKQEWQLKQEQNCKFVALTRSRSRLVFVQSEQRM